MKTYTTAELRAKVASGEYGAELLLQHAMARLEAAEAENAKLREYAALYLERIADDGVEYEQQAELRTLLGKT